MLVGTWTAPAFLGHRLGQCLVPLRASLCHHPHSLGHSLLPQTPALPPQQMRPYLAQALTGEAPQAASKQAFMSGSCQELRHN